MSQSCTGVASAHVTPWRCAPGLYSNMGKHFIFVGTKGDGRSASAGGPAEPSIPVRVLGGGGAGMLANLAQFSS